MSVWYTLFPYKGNNIASSGLSRQSARSSSVKMHKPGISSASLSFSDVPVVFVSYQVCVYMHVRPFSKSDGCRTCGVTSSTHNKLQVPGSGVIHALSDVVGRHGHDPAFSDTDNM